MDILRCFITIAILQERGQEEYVTMEIIASSFHSIIVDQGRLTEKRDGWANIQQGRGIATTWCKT